MLIPYERLAKTPVMSLQTGAELATTRDIVVDPRDLTVVAYELEGSMLDEHPSYLRPIDVRELSSLGFIVDSSEEFVGIDDVIKIREVSEFDFKLIGLDVYDDNNHKLGKVQSYNLDAESFSVQQLVLKRPMLRSLNESELIIHRNQVKEVTNSRIIVTSANDNESVSSKIRAYANPFRATSARAESIKRHD